MADSLNPHWWESPAGTPMRNRKLTASLTGLKFVQLVWKAPKTNQEQENALQKLRKFFSECLFEFIGSVKYCVLVLYQVLKEVFEFDDDCADVTYYDFENTNHEKIRMAY